MTTTTPTPTNVVRTGSTYMYDDLYAYWYERWNGEAVERIVYDSGYSGPTNAPVVNASVEVLEQVAKWTQEQAIARLADRIVEESIVDANTVRKGDQVVVVSGRKVAKGTAGRVFWMEEGGFEKIGIALDDEKDASGRHTNVAWTYRKNVALVDAADLVITHEEALEMARESYA